MSAFGSERTQKPPKIHHMFPIGGMAPSVLIIESNSQENVMALTCPRCGTDVPTEAMYCPYCSLPKPKRGFVSETNNNPKPPVSEQPAPRAVLRSRKVATPPKNERKQANQRPASKPGKPKPARKLRVSVLSLAAIVAVFSVGIYIFVVPMVYSEEAEPKTILSALEKLRHLPSSEPGLTVDARLARELETAKRVGNLVSYQGWAVRPIKGTKNRVLLVFSYQEVGDVHQSAEWLADLNNNTFTPQTDLAKTISAP